MNDYMVTINGEEITVRQVTNPLTAIVRASAMIHGDNIPARLSAHARVLREVKPHPEYVSNGRPVPF